ncbi:MAG: hypothetical protein WBG08_07025 [Litorimonas sp.]
MAKRSRQAGWVLAAIVAASFAPLASQASTGQASTGADVSPTLLIETGPSDNPAYRRMVFVRYLAGDQVSVSYAAYNRSEFIQVEDATPGSLVSACANGAAATLDEILAYNAAETEARENGTDPVIAHFCIKNVEGWEAGNRAAWLDPIFDGMPHAATLNN